MLNKKQKRKILNLKKRILKRNKIAKIILANRNSKVLLKMEQ